MGEIYTSLYADCYDHAIKSLTDKTILKKSSGVHIGLPNPFISPNKERFNNDQFYWDTYFTILGLIEINKVGLAKGMVDNLAHMFSQFGIIPSRNRYYNLGVSQIPFLTSMVLAVYQKEGDKKWLKKMADIAEKELSTYWKNGDGGNGKEIHQVYQGLSRYCDHYILNETAEHESGWDMTSRFYQKCLSFLPIDLNVCLYKYETDLAFIHKELGNGVKSKKYLELANKRKKTINDLMWNERNNFYYDYDYKGKKQSKFLSLAGFYPMWAGMITPERASKMVTNLKKFEERGGLANSQKAKYGKEFHQWDYPNGWPNQHLIVVDALRRYGYDKDAKRIAKKYLDTIRAVYEDTGKIWEKYDVTKIAVGLSGRYPTESGFAWTDSTFIVLFNYLK